MVYICPTIYPADRLPIIQPHLDRLKRERGFVPDDFQKNSMEAIVTGNHVLVTAPTGTGKTFCGEFALETLYRVLSNENRRRKTIYCCPIKALSAEKFYQFTHMYPDIRVGIVTGDTKLNTDADVLIMTTEILLHKLLGLGGGGALGENSRFDMNIQEELACVVFDEIHFINDRSRGHVWEKSLLLLPHTVQIVGLSATLDNPMRFAEWLERSSKTEGQGREGGRERIVYLAQKTQRPVPLIHSTFITCTQTLFGPKCVRDKAQQEEIKRAINKPMVLMDSREGVFRDATYLNTQKLLGIMDHHHHRVSRQHVLNKVSEYLVQAELLPALCYVFNRKQLEICAAELNTNLLEFDSKIPYTVDHECEQLLRQRLPNFREYLALPEYRRVVDLLRKGIGMHHAGMMPILRELTEMLFARGFIKMLFCTETMSVGINLPVKTTIFTDIRKFNGLSVDILESHAYTQAAGRAGRRGKDPVGHVIHLNNLFHSSIGSVEYKAMMRGTPPTLVSKFKFSYPLALTGQLSELYDKSMMSVEHQAKIKALTSGAGSGAGAGVGVGAPILQVPVQTMEEYSQLMQGKQGNQEKKRLTEIKRMYSDTLEAEYAKYSAYKLYEKELRQKREEIEALTSFSERTMFSLTMLLIDHGFLFPVKTPENEYDMKHPMTTLLGTIAAQIKEIPCLPVAEMYKTLKTLSTDDLILVFSCFTSISEQKGQGGQGQGQGGGGGLVPDHLSGLLTELDRRIEYYRLQEQNLGIDSGTFSDSEEDTMHNRLFAVLPAWIEASTEVEAKAVLEEFVTPVMFLGEFVKALLKIVCISQEFSCIAEEQGDLSFKQALSSIPDKLMKFVVTNQSLYI